MEAIPPTRGVLVQQIKRAVYTGGHCWGNMLKLAWANKELETFVCILGEEDVVYDVYVAAAAIDIRPTTKGVPLRNPSLHGAPHPGLEASHAQADLLPLPEAIPDDVNVRHISILLDGGYTKN
ncbi:unnamed protein product [Boreogadus saida]